MSKPEDLALQVVADVKESLGDDYDTLTDDQKESIRSTAELLLKKEAQLVVATEEAEKAEIKEQIQALESTVRDWKVWGEFAIEEAFWKGVQRAAEALGTFLASFAVEAISRIVPGL